LEDSPGELFDRRLGAFVCLSFHEGETARTAGLAIESDTHASQLNAFPGERLPELLLGDVVREIADEEPSTHLCDACCGA
jgi:hypothetical protein